MTTGPRRILALDLGDRRIGIAITDSLGVTVHPRQTRSRGELTEDIEHIRALVEADDVDEVVIGYPIHMDGRVGPQAQKTEAFAETLREALEIPITLWDERLTSVAAEEVLEELGMDWRERRKRVDAQAAILILEDYLRQRS